MLHWILLQFNFAGHPGAAAFGHEKMLRGRTRDGWQLHCAPSTVVIPARRPRSRHGAIRQPMERRARPPLIRVSNHKPYSGAGVGLKKIVGRIERISRKQNLWHSRIARAKFPADTSTSAPLRRTMGCQQSLFPPETSQRSRRKIDFRKSPGQGQRVPAGVADLPRP